MRCLVGLLCLCASGIAAAAEPVVLAPDKATARLQTDVSKEPHRLALPPELDKAGAVHGGLFKICVSDTGEVSGVQAVKSTGSAELDAAWSGTVRGWRYQPHTVDGAAAPFCYATRLQAGQGAAAADKPAIVSPQVGSGKLLSDVQKAPHKPTLPENLNVEGATLWGMYRVCVNTEGQVSGVSVIRSAGTTVLRPTDQETVDARWMETIKTWKYRPYVVDEKPAPFCYPLRLTVTSRRK